MHGTPLRCGMVRQLEALTSLKGEKTSHELESNRRELEWTGDETLQLDHQPIGKRCRQRRCENNEDTVSYRQSSPVVRGAGVIQ